MASQILALDTATEACSVALLQRDDVISDFEYCPREHTQRILPMVQQVLTKGRTRLSTLDAIAFGRGPGSFTGVRIGIGIAQGLALGAGLPMVGISTLQCMAETAWRCHQATHVLAAIDARMGEIYWAIYQRTATGEWSGEETESVVTPECAQAQMASLQGRWWAVGTGWQAWPELGQSLPLQLERTDVELPMAQDMLPLAVQALARGEAVSADQALPTYLRNEVRWKKLPGRENAGN
ncbi:MAG: tRNA threonylcarbamoyladenosine biosynthesis protein TsaB [Candidatus Erwinia impunctatus]|nr:tRNA threonylcarbamoyladenosine biosynthesis protein TsaB [Culicoides impunctatus]